MNDYQDIINYPHYELKYHKKMTREGRASQFASFQALAGYYETITEIDRITKEKKSLTDDYKYLLDIKLQTIKENNYKEEVTIIYFIPDRKKHGGTYQEYNGIIKKIDNIKGLIILENEKIINVSDIIDIK